MPHRSSGVLTRARPAANAMATGTAGWEKMVGKAGSAFHVNGPGGRAGMDHFRSSWMASLPDPFELRLILKTDRVRE